MSALMEEALALCMRLLKVFEGCRLCAYRDIVGIATVCYGSTTGVTMGMRKTQSECDALLRTEAGLFMRRVVQLVPTLADNPARLAAVTSFAYNVGLGALKASTLRRKCLSREWSQAGAQFARWNKAGGRPVKGLTLRRAAERRVFDQA